MKATTIKFSHLQLWESKWVFDKGRFQKSCASGESGRFCLNMKIPTHLKELNPMLRSMIRAHGPICPATTDSPSDILRYRIVERERNRRRRRNPDGGKFFVPVPESAAWLDTVTMPMVLVAVGVALIAKVLMMIDESKAQDRLERKIQKAPAEQGTVRMLTREEWDRIQEVRPRTPFESKLARPNARLRTGEPLRMDDVKDWTIDVLTDALTRAEESAKSR